MAAEKPDKPVQFIAKLVQLTQDRKIEWDAVTSPRSEGQVARAEFVTMIDGKKLRVFQANREVSSTGLGGVIFSAHDLSKPRVVKVPILEVLDEMGRVTYTFENKTGLNDLYEGAAYSASKVDDLMDSILRMK